MHSKNTLLYINLLLTILILAYLGYYHIKAQPMVTVVQESSSDTSDIENTVKNVIRDNPELIMQSVEQYQVQKYKQELQKASEKVKEKSKDLYNSAVDPVAGSDSPKVTVIDFFDYNCGYCKRMLKTKTQVLAEQKDVRIVFKELPILSENSIEIAKSALAVFFIAPDKYFQFHSEMLAHNGAKDKAYIQSKIQGLGINLDTFQKVKDSEKVAKTIEDNHKLAREIGLSGTPAYIVGDELIPGSLSYEDLKQKLDEQRNKK